jgi:hypothetical protein
MKRAVAVLASLVLSCPTGAIHAGEPVMEDVVRSPQDYAGQALRFTRVTLSGKITKYDVAGVRKYYLTLGSRGKTFEAGFFLAPPALADTLADKMDPETNYRVNLSCRVEQVFINRFPQWHGIVTRVDFLDADGRIVDTVKLQP